MQTVCWILGRGGLLGRSLVRAAEQNGMMEFMPESPLRWSEPDLCRTQLAGAVASFAKRTQGKCWQIVWAAGTGTMGSKEEDLRKETTTLATLLSLLGAEPALTGTSGAILYASSAGAIYAGSRDDVITEASLPSAENAYGKAKLQEEEMLKAFVTQHPSLSLLLARITNLYGPAQSSAKRQGLISHIARSILKRTPINIFVPLDTIRDYVSADDAASAMLEAGGKLRRGDILTKIIAAEEPTTIARIIGTFTTITRIPPRVITSASPLSTSYPHRMCFRSVVCPVSRTRTPLLMGIAEVLAAERKALMTR